MTRDILRIAGEEYDALRSYFIGKAEETRVPVSPVFGTRASVDLNPSIYFEVSFDRAFDIRLRSSNGTELKPGSIDYYFNQSGTEIAPVLYFAIDVYDGPIDHAQMWALRNAWLTERRSVGAIEEALGEPPLTTPELDIG
jgi:hypothetical protein